MDIVNINGYEFIKISDNGAHFVFSTALNGLDFNKNEKEGLDNLNNLKNWFGLKEIGYLNQTHSDKVFLFDGNINDGDALIIDKPETGAGVFTADCVPVLIWNRNKAVAAVVHSGWKGTLQSIVSKTIDKLVSDYDIDPTETTAYIGPHNKACCYEVGADLVEKFSISSEFKGLDIIKDRKLDLEACIKSQLLNKGLCNENIHSLNICSYCNDKFKFHSYRKGREGCGRMFSFIYFKI